MSWQTTVRELDIHKRARRTQLRYYARFLIGIIGTAGS